MKTIINMLSKHPAVYSFASIIILIFCIGPLQKLHPILMIAIMFVTPFIFIFMPYIANALDPVKIEAIKDKGDWSLDENNLGSTIKVYERKPANRRVLSIFRHKESYSQYNPAKATFTAVTVGGVTTGGWDVKDAHYSTVMGESTNKYLLCYTPNVYYKNKCSLPKEVILTAEDAEAARKQGFGKYLQGNTLILRNQVKSQNAKWAADTYAQTGDFYASSNLLVKDYTASLLTQSEMQAILDFLCGDNSVMIVTNEDVQATTKKFVCEACNRHFTGWYNECPNCHAKGKMKKLN